VEATSSLYDYFRVLSLFPLNSSQVDYFLATGIIVACRCFGWVHARTRLDSFDSKLWISCLLKTRAFVRRGKANNQALATTETAILL